MAGNVTDVLENVGSYNVTAALTTTLATPTTPTLLAIISKVILTVGITGSLANAVVLAVLVLARRQFGNSVNAFIMNQCAMDLTACVAIVANYLAIVRLQGIEYRAPITIADQVVCMLLDGWLVTSVCISSDVFGLVVITLERYFKVVHAVAHRKYYRGWMTGVGVILPWMCGTCFMLSATIGTTRVVNGQCLRFAVWPNYDVAKVRQHIERQSIFRCFFVVQ